MGMQELHTVIRFVTNSMGIYPFQPVFGAYYHLN